MLAPVGGVLIFFLIFLVLFTAGAAFVVAVDSVVDRHLTRQQRAIGLSMAVGVIPATLLAAGVAGSLGYFNPPTATERVLTLAATVAWVLLLLAVKPWAWAIMKKNDWKPEARSLQSLRSLAGLGAARLARVARCARSRGSAAMRLLGLAASPLVGSALRTDACA